MKEKLMDTVDLIKKYGIAIRQIPTEVYSCMEMRYFREGDEIVENNTRSLCRRKRIPVNPGYWMCKQIKDTDSIVRWNIRTDNLAATLEESITMLVHKIEKQ